MNLLKQRNQGNKMNTLTKLKIEKILGTKFPAKVRSNINGKLRQMPYDLCDAFGVCMGWLTKDPNNCKTFVLKEVAMPCG